MTITLTNPGQLEFDFEDFGYGSAEEARELFEACGDRYTKTELDHPPGWKYLGSGGTRTAYLSPSGVVYKIAHESPDDESISYNALEHQNFERIRKEDKLPPNWRVPKSHLHSFTANYMRYNRKLRKEVVETGRVVVMACEYVPGEPVYRYGKASEADKQSAEVAFSKAGLTDLYGANAIKRDDGVFYIIDAAEGE